MSATTLSQGLPELGPSVTIRCLRIIFSAQLCKAVVRRHTMYNENWVGASGACPFGDLSPRYDITETNFQQATGRATFLESP